jgi:dipeptidyl-peptidase-4
MSLRRHVSYSAKIITVFLLSLLLAHTSAAQQSTTAAGKALTVERIYSQPSLSGQLTRGVMWTPDGKQLSYFETKGAGKETKTELWVMDAGSGERRMLVAADKLEAALPVDRSKATQATGLGRRAPSQYQWAPNGEGILFQGPTALAWFDLKGQSARTLVSGKTAIADPKISPDGRWVGFVRDHNLWLVSLTDAKEHGVTKGGTEEIRKGELDWVYPEELEIKTAYWWAPDSSAIAYLEMDERKVSQYPLVDFLSPSGEAEMERYPPAGGANPVVRVFVATIAGVESERPVSGGEARLMDTGAETDIYIPRVNWLTDSRHVAIQRLNRAQNQLDLLIADAATGKSRTALSESDPYWINISDDLLFLKDGKRFLWSSERSGYRHLYLYDLEGKELAQLTRGDWEVTSVAGLDEAKGLVYFLATAKSLLERQVYSARLDGSGMTQITFGDGTHGAEMPMSAEAILDTYSNAMTPPRQEVLRADGKKIATLNENKVAELADYHLTPPEVLTVKSRDGLPLNAVMIKPPDFNTQKKYPVLVFTYGGPHAQVVRNMWGGANFLWHEMMAQKGFIIFMLDNRGAAGRGHAFETPLHLRLGAQELSDQRDGVQYLKSLPYVDANRIGIWGWSYGGHMTLHAMFEAGDDFKAGFAGGPVTGWNYYDSIYTERYLGLPQKNEKGYQDSSPVKYAANLKGKLLIAHGTGDDNVHFANTLKVIDNLIAAGKYVEVIAFPGRGHGVSDPPARRVLMQRVTQFFLDNL